MGCMAAQQDYEIHHAEPLQDKPAPRANRMDRGERGAGGGLDSNNAQGDAEDSWWKKP